MLAAIKRMALALPKSEPGPDLPVLSQRLGMRLPMSLSGLAIVEDPLMTETVEDWSEVRPPSRAARRRRQGHPQRIRYVCRPSNAVHRVGNSLIMHLDIAAKVKAQALPASLGMGGR